MSQLTLYEWQDKPKIENKYNVDYRQQASYGEKVFVYGKNVSA